MSLPVITTVIAVLLLTLQVNSTNVPSVPLFNPIPSETWWSPHDHIVLNVAIPGYRAFLQILRYWVNRTTTHHSIKNCYLLSRQRIGQLPLSWKMVTLQALGNDNTTLAIRSDNLDLAGFANRTGHWHVFTKYMHLIPNATILNFGDDYKSLLGGLGFPRLPRLELGIVLTLGAVEVLSNYSPSESGGDDDAPAKIALATLKVTCEAARFVPIYNHIRDGWYLPGTRLDMLLANYIVNWRTLSCALLIWSETGRWEIHGPEDDEATELYDTFDIQNPDQALQMLYFLVWPSPGMCTRPVLGERRHP
ncbi:hypothetical protein ACP70R_024700 [Stipagrostis hirtigluma subsp. patula]